MKFEYMISSLAADLDDATAERRLDVWGEDGWELVSVSPDEYRTTFYLKREKPELVAIPQNGD